MLAFCRHLMQSAVSLRSKLTERISDSRGVFFII
jgi:hypothetical protein